MAVPFASAYLNGQYRPLSQCWISPLDRGFLFADGVYEVVPVLDGRLFRLTDHLLRLQQSLDGIALANPYSTATWRDILTELVERNGGGDQAVYLQITRGADNRRDHVFPTGVIPTVFVMSSPLQPANPAACRQGITAITREDTRWKRCDVKSIALLANILVRQEAAAAGADEAILIRNGHVTEGSSSTVFMVRQQVIMTPPINMELLPGITREVILELAAQHNLAVREMPVPASLLASCDEIWISSSTRDVLPVTKLDGRPVGSGVPGPLWQQMYSWFQDYKADPTAWQ